jgi:hypothetical protein
MGRRGDDALHVLRRQVPRQRRETPLRDSGHGRFEAARASSRRRQEAEEHPDGAEGRLLGVWHQDQESPDKARRELSGILAGKGQEAPKVPPVVDKGCIADASMRRHPVAVVGDDPWRNLRARLSRDALASEKSEESPGSRQRPAPSTAPTPRASAARQVLLERIEGFVVELVHRDALERHPVAQVAHGAQVHHGRFVRVALLDQELREAIDVLPDLTDPIARDREGGLNDLGERRSARHPQPSQVAEEVSCARHRHDAWRASRRGAPAFRQVALEGSQHLLVQRRHGHALPVHPAA